MKFINWITVSIFLIALNSNALYSKSTITQQQAEDVVHTFIQYLKDRNTYDLTKLLDANYTHIHGTGLVEDKDTFIDALKYRKRTYVKANLSDLKITTLDNTAYVVGKLSINVTTPRGSLEATNVFTIIMNINKANTFSNTITILQFQATKID